LSKGIIIIQNKLDIWQKLMKLRKAVEGQFHRDTNQVWIGAAL